MCSDVAGEHSIHTKIPTFDGPFISSLAFRMSYSGHSRPTIAKVEEYFHDLAETGYGKYVKDGRGYILFKRQPDQLEDEMLLRMGCTQDEYQNSFTKVPFETEDREKFVEVVRKCPFLAEIEDSFQVVLEEFPTQPEGPPIKIQRKSQRK